MARFRRFSQWQILGGGMHVLDKRECSPEPEPHLMASWHGFDELICPFIRNIIYTRFLNYHTHTSTLSHLFLCNLRSHIVGRKEDGIAVFHPRNNQEGTTHPSNQSFCYHFCKRLTLVCLHWKHGCISQYSSLPNFGQSG
jgi:hypothetical protein